MSKRGSKRNRNRPRTTGVTSQAAKAEVKEEKSLGQELDEIETSAIAEATDGDFEVVSHAPPPEPGISVEEMIKRAHEARVLLEEQTKRAAIIEERAGKKEAALNDREHNLEDQKAALLTLEGELKEKDAKLRERETKVEDIETDLLKRLEDIIKRELDADAGFSQRNREALAKLEAEGATLREQYTRQRKQIDDERVSLEREILTKRQDLAKEFETELGNVRAQIDNEREELSAESKRIKRDARDIAVDRELLEEDRAAFEEAVARRAAREVEVKDGEILALAERLAASREERDRIAKQLALREEADLRFGAETPDQVMERLRALERERDQLRKALGGRPSAEAAQRLEELERAKELWESDKSRLLADLGEARQEAVRKRIAVTELESLRDEKRSLESANALLHEANRQLRAEVDALVKGVEGKSPFPSCSAMDADVDLQSTRSTTDTIRDLAEFAHYVRHRMAWDPNTKKTLYYAAEDVRSFLGGLAMSRLHLLQGISGTGKTSLPLAFARAIGAGSALVEVQAGWRDRQDLIGHFNTFERRFYESEFLQSMYRASLPVFRDTPFIIVLDEMNLSHPEQYFADLLSALEQDQNRQRLVLMTAAVDPAPMRLIDGGTKIRIPPNVWFVGTANHDETTKDFADKTYDRAHVMELPRNRETFDREDFQPQNPVSIDALQNAFSVAVNRYKEDAVKSYQFLQTQLGEMLGRRFRVGWGNRLERQISLYVPVVVAAGGSVGEATDYILTTKLLRKIRDRHDNRPEDIIALRERIQTEWSQLDNRTEPVRSLSVLRNELHRLGHDDD
jgi:hypothetical protein